MVGRQRFGEVCGRTGGPVASILAGIRLDGLVWDAGGAIGLPGVIEVQRGEVVAVVAAGDAGTVLADVLVGLVPPAGGTVRLVPPATGTAGIADRGRPDPRLVTLIPAGGALLPQRTVAQNITFGDRATMGPQARENRVVELAQLFRVAGVLRLHPHRLSPAQRLGVAAARALGSEPRAVVLEDRAGQPDCATVVAALASHDVAVIVITDSAARAALLTDHVVHARRASPAGPAPGPEPAAVGPAPRAEPAASGPGGVEGGRDVDLA